MSKSTVIICSLALFASANTLLAQDSSTPTIVGFSSSSRSDGRIQVNQDDQLIGRCRADCVPVVLVRERGKRAWTVQQHATRITPELFQVKVRFGNNAKSAEFFQVMIVDISNITPLEAVKPGSQIQNISKQIPASKPVPVMRRGILYGYSRVDFPSRVLH